MTMDNTRGGSVWLSAIGAAWIVLLVCGACATAAPAESGQSYVSITKGGAWCWFAEPRAVYYEGDHKRTYIGWVTTGGSIQIGCYDHQTDTTDVATLHSELQRDDHANPALLIFPDGRLTAFYSTHSGRTMYCRTTKRPEDISEWEDERSIATTGEGSGGYTYPNPIRLSAEGNRIYLFWRGSTSKPTFSTSDDGGVHWSDSRTFIRRDPEKTGRPYIKFDSNGVDTIHFAFTDGHPRNEAANSIYYACYRHGALYKADGTKIKGLDELPLSHLEADKVYDGSGETGRAWIWDVAADSAGNPVIVFAACPEETEHNYWYARWNGSRWDVRKITSAGGWFPQTPEGKKEGEPHYSAGVVLDHNDPSIVYLSKPTNGVFEIERWVTPDGGATWTSTRITKDSSWNNVRPVVARDHKSSDSGLFWMHGDYEHYTKYATAIKMDLSDVDRQRSLIFALRQPTVDDTLAVMKRASLWQFARIADPQYKASPTGWVRGALLTGVMGAYHTTDDHDYLDAALRLCEANEWKPGPRPRHADDHCIGQTYCELYMLKKDEAMIAPLRETFDNMMEDPKPGREDWWWCDALFMAPPAFARMSAATGDRKYLDFMNTMWWDATDFLYDKEEHLFYRDKRFFPETGRLEKNGRKVFWGRGNGWVAAGTVRVLQYVPQDYPDRERYIRLHQEMAEKLAAIQGEDGLWRASLLDPDSYPIGEASGSGFFCYALAWGVNNGYLDREKYAPVVMKAWRALAALVDNEGKLCWVQPVGGDPRPVSREDTQEYAVGAVLLAGSEVAKLMRAQADSDE
jgi:rhamnogalacturonyl hydrolase YesR